MKKLITLALALILALSLAACAKKDGGAGEPANASAVSAGGTVYRVGVCNYVDHASLNQIVDSLTARLTELGTERGVSFDISLANCNADSAVMNQIITNDLAGHADLLVGVATPVAMAMQAATGETNVPVVFAAVSDPVSVDLVDSLDAPGGNVTGTSDYLNTNAMLDLIFAADPQARKIGLLYDVGQDSSATPIAAAKAYLDAKGVAYVERTGTNTDEIRLAAQALVADGVDAVFTPTDNTVMNAELAIYETFTAANIPHYAGADSFALNGALLGYGVDYAALGAATAEMVFDILVNGADPAATAVRTFDNGTATINTDVCAALGLDYDDLSAKFAPYCTNIQPITTAESFE